MNSLMPFYIQTNRCRDSFYFVCKWDHIIPVFLFVSFISVVLIHTIDPAYFYSLPNIPF
jgi:hypothetical protein